MPKSSTSPMRKLRPVKAPTLYSHPLNIGGVGDLPDVWQPIRLVRKQTWSLVWEQGNTDFTTASKWLYQNPDVDFVNINVAGFDSYKLDAVRVTADAKMALAALREALVKEGYKSAYTD